MKNFEDNIEKQYHERFQDFEDMPDDTSWSKIQERITPEAEQRPVVFWWNNFRTIGVAAGVIFGLLCGGYYFSSVISTEKVVYSEKITPHKSSQNAQKIEPNNADLSKETTQTEKDLNPKENSKKVEQSKDDLQEKNTKFNNEIATKSTQKIKVFERNIADAETKIVRSDIKKNTPNEKAKLPNAESFSEINSEQNLSKNALIVGNITKKPAKIQEKAIDIEIDKSESAIVKDSKIANEKNNFQEKTIEKKQVEFPEKQNSDLVILNENKALKIEKSDKNESLNFTENPLFFNEEIAYLIAKNIKIGNIEKPIIAPAIANVEPDLVFEKVPKSHLVFIPPNEVFVNVSPMLNYYVFSPNIGDNLLVKNVNGSSDRLSFAAQLGFVYSLNKKLDLRTGLSFLAGHSAFSYDFTNNSERIVTVIDEQNIIVQPAKGIKTESRNWQYLELQSDLLYEIKRNHAISVGMRAGVQASALSKPIFNGRIGYRISKPITRRVALWVEPSMAVSLSSQKSIENLFLYRSRGFGLNVGVSLLRHY